MPYGQYSKNNNGYSDVPEGASGVIDFGDGNVTTTGKQGRYVNGVKSESYADGVTSRYNGRNSNNGGGSYNQNSQDFAAQSANMTRQAGRDAITNNKQAGFDAVDIARARDQDLDRSREKGLSADFARSDQASRRDNAFKVEETEKDRAKSSAEFRLNQNMIQNQMNQDRSNQEFQSGADLRRDKQSQDNESWNRANDRIAQANLQQQSNETNKQLASISQQTAIAGQGAQTEQARIAAKSQVTAALMGGRSNYGGYW